MELTNEVGAVEPVSDKADVEVSPSDRALVQKITKIIKADKTHHEKAFKRMRRDMFVALYGRDPDYPADSYAANLAGRHVKQKTASLYAKNPKAVARRRETLDFAVWDENPDSLMLAFQTVQQGAMMQQQAALTPPQIDPVTGQPVMAEPQLPPGFMEAQQLIEDFQQGMERRTQIAKIGKTLEVVYAHALREQKPVDFKQAMKQVVRRACTTGVGYVELGVKREYGTRPDLVDQVNDIQLRLDHLRRLSEEAAEGDITQDDPEAAELERSLAALQQEPEIVVQEGLVFDFPQSTRVIPDRMCHTLMGFVGARHLTIEYLFTVDEVHEMFPGVDLGKAYTGYNSDGCKANGVDEVQTELAFEDIEEPYQDSGSRSRGDDLVCVWKHYDKPSGLVYYIADGHPKFLREPAAPDVFVEDFWPVVALTFNAVESEKELFPPSDVSLILPMQNEYNRSRQGMREHRQAARPRWGYANGRLDAEDIAKLTSMKPFEAVGLSIDGQTKLMDVLQTLPVPGVDPNLYETGQLFTDVQLVVGSSEAQFGGTAQATATESAIAANSSASSDGSAVDDLDTFLTTVARMGGQILLREMSEEKVREIAGPGAVWPQMSLAEIAGELFLEIEAGSSGKPNQAIEIRNWKEMLPFLVQMPNINAVWLARETVRRLDDKLDLTEAIAAGMPSVVMQNAQKQAGTGDPASDPAAQGAEGQSNGPAGPAEQSAGSGPAFGSNQV